MQASSDPSMNLSQSQTPNPCPACLTPLRYPALVNMSACPHYPPPLPCPLSISLPSCQSRVSL
ncbi:hypothetical protein E2C01_090250 [Portunus trituberculatus]|uniref:Uncharacterized protein n=1 Tax=Portunus trituberculatus TaxID=210409 RepID=A0A5B7JKE2_PORTR|nr:hypothetical protein [Portunus trituberculatus]